MAKKCEKCHEKIDVHKGGYVNVYWEAWEMHTFHASCYAGLVLESYISLVKKSSRVGINATPDDNPAQRTLDDIFLTLINATPRENKCNTINATPVRFSL